MTGVSDRYLHSSTSLRIILRVFFYDYHSSSQRYVSLGCFAPKQKHPSPNVNFDADILYDDWPVVALDRVYQNITQLLALQSEL